MTGLKLGTLVVGVDGDTTGLEQAETVVKNTSNKINDNLKKTEKQVKVNTKALGGFGRRFGQAGIQVQQFVGQIQGGQNAMLALSQQSADLGFVLGAPLLGAIAGIGATIIGSLLPSLFNAKDATEELEDSFKRLDDVAIETGGGIEVLSKKLIELAKKSQQAAKAEIQSGILAAMNAIKIAAKEADSVLNDLFGGNLKSTGSNALFLQETILNVSKSLKITTRETGNIIGAFREFRKEQSTENLEDLQKILDGLAVTYGTSAPKVVKLAEQFRLFTMKATSAKERMDFLKTALIDLDTVIEKSEKTTKGQAAAVEKYINALAAQVGALGLTGGALAEYESDLIGATEAEKAQIVALKEKLQAFKDAEKAVKEDEKTRKAAQKNLSRIKAGGLSEEGKGSAEVKSTFDALQESLALEQITQSEFDELALQAAQKQSDELLKIETSRQLQQAQLNQQALSNLTMFHSAATDLIQAAGKEGTAVAKAAFLAGKAIQVAQIIAATQVAAIQAGAVAALGGPVPFFATVGAVETLGFASAALVGGLAIGQGFEQGGIVGGNSMTGDKVPARVNSGEMILTTRQQSKLFSMANNSGGSEGGTPSVNIINNGAPIDVQGQSVSKDEITLMINNGVKQGQKEINQSLASGRGPSAQSVQKGFRVERKI